MLADTYAGEEGRWRYGALLLRMGRTAEAGEVFRRMLRNAERMPEHYREAQQEWLALARHADAGLARRALAALQPVAQHVVAVAFGGLPRPMVAALAQHRFLAPQRISRLLPSIATKVPLDDWSTMTKWPSRP